MLHNNGVVDDKGGESIAPNDSIRPVVDETQQEIKKTRENAGMSIFYPRKEAYKRGRYPNVNINDTEYSTIPGYVYLHSEMKGEGAEATYRVTAHRDTSKENKNDANYTEQSKEGHMDTMIFNGTIDQILLAMAENLTKSTRDAYIAYLGSTLTIDELKEIFHAYALTCKDTPQLLSDAFGHNTGTLGAILYRYGMKTTDYSLYNTIHAIVYPEDNDPKYPDAEKVEKIIEVCSR